MLFRSDGTLDLAGTVKLGPPLVQKLTLGKVTPPEELPLTLKLKGKAWSPEVTDLDVKPAVTTLAKLAAADAATRLLGDKGEQVGKIITGGKDAAKEAAQAELDKRQKELEERARQEKEAASKRAEEEAKKRLKGLFGR